jgi:hypothetical protein
MGRLAFAGIERADHRLATLVAILIGRLREGRTSGR